MFSYEELPRVIIDETTKQIAFPKLIPSLLATGELKVKLAPLCEVRGSIVCEELAKIEQPMVWTNVYLEANGKVVAECSSGDGKFDFLVPPGVNTCSLTSGGTGADRVSKQCLYSLNCTKNFATED